MLISVVIPTLNEAEYLEATLRSVETQSIRTEVIIADGGSADSTIRIAKDRANVVQAKRGRAWQMNAGARAASGSVLLFIHADTQLPAGAMHDIAAAVSAGFDGGTFRLAFDKPGSLLRRVSSWMTNVRSPLICFGDRGLFVTRETFETLGGYPEIPIFEDLELSAKLFRCCRFRFLESCVTTSARRFRQHGDFRRQWLNANLWVRYLLGAHFDELAQAYPYEARSSNGVGR